MSDYYKDVHKYDDMMEMPHHRSAGRPHMSLQDRAAQFAPFAALTGYEEAIEETALEAIHRKLNEIEHERAEGD